MSLDRSSSSGSVAQTASEADWLIGQGLFTAKVSGVALRSMKDPGGAYDDPILGKDPQPGHMRDYVVTLEDGGGVHINSGIPNHAFFLTAAAMGGHAWEKAGQDLVRCGPRSVRSNTDFRGAASLTHAVAGELYGAGSDEQKAVQYGWESVGIPVTAAAPTQPPSTPSGCLAAPARPLVLRSGLGCRSTGNAGGQAIEDPISCAAVASPACGCPWISTRTTCRRAEAAQLCRTG